MERIDEYQIETGARQTACYLQEDDPPENHDLRRYSAVCGLCYAALDEMHKAEIARLQSLLADSALYIRRMASICEGYEHPSRIHRRAKDFANRRLTEFERKIVPMHGEPPSSTGP